MYEQYSNFDLICRFCMRYEKDTQKLNSLYDFPNETNGQRMNYAEIYMTTTPRTEMLHPTDGLPQLSCQSCLEQLIKMHKFQQMCAESGKQFRKMLKSFKSKQNAEIEQQNTTAALPINPIIVKEEIEIEQDIDWPQMEFIASNPNDLADLPKMNLNKEFTSVNVNDSISRVQNLVTEQNYNSLPQNPCKPHACTECRKTFANENELKLHRKRHRANFECTFCSKAFKYASQLNKHMVIHQPEKAYVCEICGQGFRQRTHLSSHLMSHGQERPYKCEHCDMSFKYINNLRVHLRKHTGEKPYKCKYCKMDFRQSATLVKHLQVHLGDKVYNCELCPSGFVLAVELRNHYKVHQFEDAATSQRNLAARREKDALLKSKFVIKLDRVE